MAVAQEDGSLREETQEEFDAFFAQPGLVHFAVMAMRPGCAECLQTLEHVYYKPKTRRNKLFSMRFIEWGGLGWFIVSIPAHEREHMEKSAAASGLRIADGVPHMINNEGLSTFPGGSLRMFALENVPGHRVYKQGHL